MAKRSTAYIFSGLNEQIFIAEGRLESKPREPTFPSFKNRSSDSFIVLRFKMADKTTRKIILKMAGV
uniref:Uncharacterized protein n=1 Tax=Strigamia maritima TaxID=126957 RepID=T1IJN8_STRMM